MSTGPFTDTNDFFFKNIAGRCNGSCRAHEEFKEEIHALEDCKGSSYADECEKIDQVFSITHLF